MPEKDSAPIVMVALVLAIVGIYYFSLNPSVIFGPQPEPPTTGDASLLRDIGMIGQEIESPEDNTTGEIQEMDILASDITLDNSSF